MIRFASLLVIGALLLVGCDDTVVVQLRTGPQELELSTAELALPDALRDETSGEARIAMLACGPMGMCPTPESVPITCEAGICDPASRTLSAPIGGVIDFDVLSSEARSLVRQIEAIEVLEASYTVAANTMSVDLPETELFWGPEGAIDVDPAMGVVAIGILPAIPARSAEPGQVVLDPEGVSALSDYLVSTSRRVRLFARTRVDLVPGGAFPEGSVRLAVDLVVRITGSVVR